ncbi:MAG: hypothetical protein U9N33_09570 [Campylobacterota bacterium]|nr:hypothetical protein [Campylobacterota bacterium]
MSYDFDIVGVLKEGFHRSDGAKLIFGGAIGIYVVLSILVGALLEFIFPQSSNELNRYVTSFLEMIFMLPLLVGIMILGIKRARDEELVVPSIFNYYALAIPLSLAYIAMTLLTIVGFLLLVLPGIYLAVSYAFTYTLIVDKGLGIWEAMELSRKTVTKQWFKFFGLSLACGIIIIISALPLGIGLIWSIPMTYITYGLLYHHLFDDEDMVEENIKEIERND